METSSNTFTIRVDPLDKQRLETLAKSTGRSRSFLAADAIAKYLDINEWQVARIRQAMASMDAGKFIEHQAISDWVDSWGTENELPPPEPKSA